MSEDYDPDPNRRQLLRGATFKVWLWIAGGMLVIGVGQCALQELLDR